MSQPATRETHRVKTAIVADYYPYSFVNKLGQPDGFSVDLAKAVTSVMGMDLEVNVDTWDRARQDLETGAIDLLPMMAYSVERDVIFDFSAPHTIAYDALFTRKGDVALYAVDELKGRTVIVMKDDQAHDYLRSSGLVDSEHLILTDSLPDALRLLSSGQGDAALMPKLVGLLLIKKLNLTNLTPSPVVIDAYDRPFSFAVRHGHQALLERLSQGLDIVKNTGQYREIYDRWFAAVEPRELTLRAAMKYIAGLLAALLVIGAVFALWSFSLRKQVALRTQKLESEIDERKKAEEALRESREILRAILDSIPARVFWKSRDLTYLGCNRSFARDAGFETPEELVGKDDYAMAWREQAELYRADDRAVITDGNVKLLFEEPQTTPTGEQIELLTSKVPLRDADGRIIGVLGTYLDVTERKRAQDALRASEQRYRTAQAMGHVGNWEYDLQTTEFWGSDEAKRIFGLDPEQVRFSTEEVERCIPERDRVHQALIDLIEKRTPYHLEFEIRPRNSAEPKIIASVAELQRDEHGAPAKIVGVIQDITERKRAEEAQRRAEEETRLTLAATTDGIWKWNSTTSMEEFNDRYYRMLGYEPGEFPATHDAWADRLHPDDQARVLQAVQQCLDRRADVYDTEYRLRTKRGDYRWIRSHATVVARDAHGAAVRVIGSHEDVTARKQAEEALRASEERFRRVVEHISDALIADDAAGKVVFANDRFLDLFGLARPDLDTLMLEDYVAPEWREKLRDRHDRRIRGEAVPSHFEYEGQRRDGRRLWLEVDVVPISEADGRVTGTQSAIRDITARKQAEEALRASEARYHTLFNAGQDAIFVFPVKSDGAPLNFTEANNASCRMHGYTREELFARSPADLIAPEYHGRMPALDSELIKNQQVHVEWEDITKDGRRIPVEVTVTLFELAGQPTCMAVVRDITERKQTERALRESEERYRGLVETSPDAIFVSRAGKMTYINSAGLTLFGATSAEQVIGRAVFDFIHPDWHGVVRERIRRHHETGRPVPPLEQRYLRLDGTAVDVEVAAGSVTLGEEQATQVIVRDITARKQAAAERERLSAAVEQAAEAIVITDPTGKIEYVNPAFERITGYSRAEVIGQNPRLLKSGRHDEAYYRTLWRTITGGAAWNGRFINRKKDGTVYEEEAAISPVKDASGKIVNFVAVKRDVTHERSLEGQLRHAQKMEAVGQLAAGVAHDFDNLLTALHGYADIGRKWLDDGHPACHALDGIEQVARQATGLTKALLTFSGHSQTTKEPVQLNLLVTETARLLKRMLPGAIELRVEVRTDAPLWIHADETQLQQVLMNLVLNARDAMSDGGAIRISVARRGATGGDPTGSGTDLVELAVQDTGVGLSPEVKARMFEPFFTTKSRGRGTGLGLAIVHGIVKEHNGTIEVESELGSGSTFRVVLPLAPASAGAAGERSTATMPSGHGELILVAEDDEYLRALLAGALTQLGYTVVAAEDGDEVLRRHKERSSALRLLVLDFDLPRRTGGECLKLIRQAGDQVPAIIMSGAAHIEPVAQQFGATLLRKPFKIAQLGEAILQALHGSTAGNRTS